MSRHVSSCVQSFLPMPVYIVIDWSIVFAMQVKHDDGQQVGRTQKVISEIFLTRLLATKVWLNVHQFKLRDN